MDTDTKGPSKKELKKMAKKAEKAALKKEVSNKPTTKTTTATTTTNDQNNISPAQQPELLLANLTSDGDSLSAIKAVWASLLYQVPLKKTSRAPPSSSNMAHGPVLVYNDEMIVMGGNSMAKAIASLGHTKKLDPHSVLKVDDWCEWERVHLRHSHNVHNALGHLEHVFSSGEGGSPFHLVGHDATVADICVVASLSQITKEHSRLPPSVAQYVQAHGEGLAAAHEALASLPTTTTPPHRAADPTTSLDLDHPSLEHVMAGVFRSALEQLFGPAILQDSLRKNFVTKCSNPKHGDYQCSAAMPIFAALKKQPDANTTGLKSPQEVANALIGILQTPRYENAVSDLQVNGPGFVLCRLAPPLLKQHLHHYLYDLKHLPMPLNINPETCLVDFSSPNISKEMHVGHLRSTILGESICRVLEKAGNEVHRINHVGDWGTQFGMLIQYLKEEYPNFHLDMPNITDLTEFYKSAKQRFDESPEFKKCAQTNVVRLQSGNDDECMEIWKILCDVSRVEFEKVYRRLDISVRECGESFYNDKIPAVLEEFEKADLLSIEQGGAKCVFVDGFKVPLMLQKSDGGFGYDSTDMAAIKYRLQELKCRRVIVVTDFSQGDHFKMCYAAARKIGWVTDHQKLEHVGFGTVMGEDGKRFKTRSGDTVRLVDLLDEAVKRMEDSLKERIAEDKANITLDEVHKVAEAIGYGAVKYFDLRRNPTSNYKFSYDQMLDTNGNTAVYLLYAHARLESICSKALADYQVDVNELMANKTELIIEHPSERNLVFHLLLFADTLAMTLEDLFPYHICDYLYNLSIAASSFATHCKVLGSPEMNSRLILCRATTMAMRECFDLLGIRHVDRI